MRLNARPRSAISSGPATGTGTGDRPWAIARAPRVSSVTGRTIRRASQSATSAPRPAARAVPPQIASVMRHWNVRSRAPNRPRGRPGAVKTAGGVGALIPGAPWGSAGRSTYWRNVERAV